MSQRVTLQYMKKAVTFALLGLCFIPYTASAAWWNPFTWKRASVPSSLADDAFSTSTQATTTDASLLPTADDLYKRIAELEMKLDRARADLESAQSTARASVPATSVASTQASSNGSLSDKDVLAKVKPAIVLVEGLFGRASGTIIDAQGHILTNFRVIGTSTEATVILSSGSKKKATVIGLEEANDLAVLQLSDKKSSAYVTPSYGTSISVGDTAYVVGFQGSEPSGSAFVSATIDQKTSSSIRATGSEKPLDNGGALITSKGTLIGIPGRSTCKVLEDMSTCLKHSVTASLFPTRVPLLVQGMRLYKEKKGRTIEEELFHGYLEGLYSKVSSSDTVMFAVNSVTGKNSFSYFDTKLVEDTEGKIARLYALKLKSASENILKAFDFLKSVSYSFSVSLINDSASISKLDLYQQKMIAQVQADNAARLKVYQAQIDLWTKKKNEYDGYIANPSDATNDYYMAEGVSVEKSALLLEKERKAILDGLSTDVRGVF
jgi:putative serine protease PepD